MSQDRAEVVKKRIAEAGQLYRATMEKAYAGTCSPRSAIRAQCLICMGYDREAITTCTGYSCPLYAFRPYQAAGQEGE
jgi:hypothetical protein